MCTCSPWCWWYWHSATQSCLSFRWSVPRLSAQNQVWLVFIEKSAYACKDKLWKQTFWWGAETHSSERLGGYSINKNSMGVSLSTVTSSTPPCRHPVLHPLTSCVMLHVFFIFLRNIPWQDISESTHTIIWLKVGSISMTREEYIYHIYTVTEWGETQKSMQWE